MNKIRIQMKEIVAVLLLSQLPVSVQGYRILIGGQLNEGINISNV